MNKYLMLQKRGRDFTIANRELELQITRFLKALFARGVTAMIELAPAGVLTGLARRALPGVETVAIKTPDDLEAAHRIRHLSYRIDLYGEGELENGVRDHVAQLALDDRINFKGTTDDIPTVLTNADVFVLSSRWESFPLSILEAMSAGCAVIATDVGGVSEAIKDGHNGLLVPPDDFDALATAMRRVIEHAGLRARLGAAARADYESNFQLKSMTEPTIALYRHLEGRR